MFEHLFNPLMVGKVTLPNRICFLAHRTNFARGGRLDNRHVAYYRRRSDIRDGSDIRDVLNLQTYLSISE